MAASFAQIQFLLAALDLVERRLGDVEVTALDQLTHVAVEEGQQQGQDVGAVHVGVGHDDDPAVAQLGDVEVVLADAGAQGRDQGADLLGGDHLVETGLFHVEDLALERQDGLKLAVTPLLGRAAGRITLDQVQFAQLGILLLAVRQFARQSAQVQSPFTPNRFPGLAGRFTGPGRLDGFFQDALGNRGILFQELGQFLVDQGLNIPLDLGVAQLGLGLSLELRLGDLDRDDTGQTLAQVIARDGDLLLLEQIVGGGIAVHGTGQGRLEADQMGATLMGIDVVGKGEDLLIVGVVVLHGDLGLHAAFLTLEVDRFGVQCGLVAVEILDKGVDAPLVVEFVGFVIHPLIVDLDPHTGVEEGHLSQTLGKHIKGKFGGFEDLLIRHKGDLGAALLGLADHLQWRHGIAAAVGLPKDLAVTADLQFQPSWTGR